MIKNDEGQRMTPKQKANQILMDGVSVTLGYWIEKTHVTEGMTGREREEIQHQMKKQADRVAKLLGYEEAWYS